jgi:CheY-like chemotaxis protein/CHASE3 domain sensor protein
MNRPTTIDPTSFRRILLRNVTVPLAAGCATAALFVGLIIYLLSALHWVEHTERVIGNANEITKLSVDLETGLRGYLLTGDEAFLAPYRTGKAKMSAEMATLAELVADNPVQLDRLGRIRALQTQWDEFARNMISLQQQKGDFSARLRAGEGKVEFDEIRREFDAFLATESRLRQERNAAAENRTVLAVGFFLLVSLTLSGVLAFSGRRELMRLSLIYNEALQDHAHHSEQLQQQAWLRAGQTGLAERSAGQLALPQLGQAILDYFADRLGIAVGALYAAEPGGALQRTATYGFSAGSVDSPATFRHGEGLVGETARERKLKHLAGMAGNYLRVTSSLGEGAPVDVVLLPVENEGKVNGVLELGFVRPATRRDLELLNMVASNIGTFIDAALYRQRLQQMLEETQQLNEEMEVQQEELRTANESLSEQSRILEESQAHLEHQKAALELSNEQLAVQALALDQKNIAIGEANAQLELRAEELRRSSRYKSEFLANMSHELRTPLNSSLILSRLLADNPAGNLTGEQVTFAETIYSSGNDLLNLINDILDISKVEAGKLELVIEPLPFDKLLNSLNMTFAPLAGQKGLEFSISPAQQLPGYLTTDRQRLEQVLKNLLSNAVKFTDQGAVSLAVAPSGHDSVQFTVQDSGIGIAPAEQQKIFEAFHQADGTASRRHGGTGLGLSISRDLAKLLGGEISVRSAPDQGSTFILTVPLHWSVPGSADEQSARGPSAAASLSSSTSPNASASGQRERHGDQDTFLPSSWSREVAARGASHTGHSGLAAAPVGNVPGATAPVAPTGGDGITGPTPATFPDDRADSRGAGARRFVLVIEDEPEFAGILYSLAHEMGYRCLVAHGADDGVRLAAEFLPDAILLDMRLPDRPGMHVLQQLKESPRTRHIPVHVVSASDHNHAALQMGAIGYAKKPIAREELKAVFRRLEAKVAQKSKRVLLVEDDERQRDSVMRLIEDEDVSITAVALGEEALALLRKEIFDCMIIDLKLPDIPGEELLHRMSREELCSFPPVIVYTGRNLSREEEAGLMKYSRSIIIKGARSPERLLDEVTLFLHQVEADLSSERQGMLKQARSRERVFEGRKVLLVDDDVRNIFALTNALEQKGVVVEVGRNGFEAISKLDSVPDIDLILMDVMMPGMDGLEATRRIRSDARFRKLPIIAITAKAMKNDQEECLQAGASDYLAKPIDLDRLYSLLRVWMPKMERL